MRFVLALGLLSSWLLACGSDGRGAQAAAGNPASAHDGGGGAAGGSAAAGASAAEAGRPAPDAGAGARQDGAAGQDAALDAGTSDGGPEPMLDASLGATDAAVDVATDASQDAGDASDASDAGEPGEDAGPDAGDDTLPTLGEPCVPSGAGVPETDALRWLPFRVIDGEYSAALERLVAVVSIDPPPPELTLPPAPIMYDRGCALVLLDGRLGTFESFALPSPGQTVSLSPDGLQAVVGHEGWITVYDLPAGDLVAAHAVVDTRGNDVDVRDVVHGGNGHAYVTARGQSTAWMTAVDLATGELLPPQRGSVTSAVLLQRHPAGAAVYSVSSGGPTDLARWDISSGAARSERESAHHGDHPICGELWATADGERLITSCGAVVATTADPATDMRYRGSLAMPSDLDYRSVAHAALSAASGRIATIPRSWSTRTGGADEVIVLEDAYLTPRQRLGLPTFRVGYRDYATFGKKVFFTTDGNQLVVIVETPSAEAGHEAEHGLVLLDVGPGEVLVSPPDDPPVTSGAGATALDLAVIDAAHSDARGEIILVTDDPPELVALDPDTLAMERVPLALAPSSVWLDPAGQTAIVGHDGWISWVDLRGPTVDRMLPISTPVRHAVLSDQGFIHAFSPAEHWRSVISLSTVDLSETSYSSTYSGARGVLHPDGERLYASHLRRYDISSGPVTGLSAARDTVSSACGRLHLADDGVRLFTACGAVLRADPDPDLDFAYLGHVWPVIDGSPSNPQPMRGFDHAASLGLLAGLTPRESSASWPPADVVRFYADPYMQLHASRQLPTMRHDGRDVASSGRFVFFSSDHSQVHVVARADAPAVRGYGLITLDVPMSPDPLPAPEPPIASSYPGFEVLPYRVADAAYSDVLDLVLLAAEGQPALHVVDPAAPSHQRIDLPLPAAAIALAPSGTRAAVGHDGWVSLVDLVAGRVEAIHPITIDTQVLALSDDDWVYALEDTFSEWLYRLDMGSGQQLVDRSWSVSAEQLAMRGDSAVLYASGGSLVERVDVDAGAASDVWISSPQACRKLAFLDDGVRMLTGCGTVLQTDDDPQLDLAPYGALDPQVYPVAFDHASATGTIAAVERGGAATIYRDQLHLFDDASLGLGATLTVPDFRIDTVAHTSTTRWVFLNGAGTVAYLIVRDGTQARHDALVTMPLPP